MNLLTPHFRARWALAALTLGGVLVACGGSGTTATSNAGGGTGTGTGSGGSTGTDTSSSAQAPTPAPPLAALNLATCEPSGVSGATDYQVGDGLAYASLDAVPWESLKAGDTVRIFYRAAPYKGKFAITSSGTVAAPIRVCGVRGPGNERPVIDGNGAITRTATPYTDRIANDAPTRQIHEDRTVILIKANAAEYTSFPRYVQVDGLNIVRGHPNYAYKDSTGATRSYTDFGACVWIDRGQDITIADNEISDCQMAVFSKSSNDGDFAVTKNIRVSGNYMWGHGIVGDDHEHTTYLQSVGLVVEFNRYGPLRSGSGGNQLKDRSAGLVVRYNAFEGGAHTLDLVEAEDGFQYVVKPLASYRSTLVYGNLIRNDAGARAIVHYGGDHFGGSATDDNYGELNFRQGTLYFFNNTVRGSGSDGRIFQISTTLERVEAWNNIFSYEGTPYLRSGENDGVSAAWTRDGTLNFGVNWINGNWLRYDQYHPLLDTFVTGTANLITGTSAPFDLSTFVPLAGSAVIDAGVAGPTGASAYSVDYQLNSLLQGTARPINGSRIDLGAVER